MSPSPKKYMTVAEIPLHYPFAAGTIYQWAGKDGKPDFQHCCVRRAGRKVLIDVEAFEKWIEGEGNACE